VHWRTPALLLDALSSRLFHVGGIGTGATMKLAVNALLHGLSVALCEGLGAGGEGRRGAVRCL
jgi:3-hydroxyisobutyrate dehydrogenase-like beta-hydroxyacid dehydrogenase